MGKRRRPTPAGRRHIAEILAWLASDAVLTPAQRADYTARIAAYRDRQAALPFASDGA